MLDPEVRKGGIQNRIRQGHEVIAPGGEGGCDGGERRCPSCPGMLCSPDWATGGGLGPDDGSQHAKPQMSKRLEDTVRRGHDGGGGVPRHPTMFQAVLHDAQGPRVLWTGLKTKVPGRWKNTHPGPLDPPASRGVGPGDSAYRTRIHIPILPLGQSPVLPLSSTSPTSPPPTYLLTQILSIQEFNRVNTAPHVIPPSQVKSHRFS